MQPNHQASTPRRRGLLAAVLLAFALALPSPATAQTGLSAGAGIHLRVVVLPNPVMGRVAPAEVVARGEGFRDAVVRVVHPGAGVQRLVLQARDGVELPAGLRLSLLTAEGALLPLEAGAPVVASEMKARHGGEFAVRVRVEGSEAALRAPLHIPLAFEVLAPRAESAPSTRYDAVLHLR